MQPLQDFDLAATAAAYTTYRTAYPDRTITISGPRAFQIDGHNIEIQPLTTNSVDGLILGSDDFSIYTRPDYSFRVEADNGLQTAIEHNLNRTGFTPTTRFRGSHSRNLKGYRLLLDGERWHQHLDSLVERFPKGTEPYIGPAREMGKGRIAEGYFDMFIQREATFVGIPYSKYRRIGHLAALTGGLVALAAVSPETVQNLWQIYNDLLQKSGLPTEVAISAATITTFYLIGDLCAQYMEGQSFDKKRFLRTAGVSSLYGLEIWGFYKSLELINTSNRWLTSALRGVVDTFAYGIGHFNLRHAHIMSKEGRLGISDYIRTDKRWVSLFKDKNIRIKWYFMSAYNLLFWFPFQTWNRAANDPEQVVFYVSMAAPPFTTFMSLVSNDKKELVEFQNVMDALTKPKVLPP